jgi:hypothetical protein
MGILRPVTRNYKLRSYGNLKLENECLVIKRRRVKKKQQQQQRAGRCI